MEAAEGYFHLQVQQVKHLAKIQIATMSHNHINPWVMEDKTNKPILPAVCCFIPVLILDRLQDLSTRTHSGQNTFQLFFEKCLESVLSVSWPRYLVWEPVRGALPMTTFTTRTGTLCGMLSPRALKTSSFCLSNHPLAPWSLCNPKEINSSQKNSKHVMTSCLWTYR